MGDEVSASSTPSGLPHAERRPARSLGILPPFLAILAILVVILLVMDLPSIEHPSSNSGSTCPAGITVTGAGSDAEGPLMSTWTGLYTAAALDYQTVGDYPGLQYLQSLGARFAAGDSPPDAVESGDFAGPTVTVPEAADPIAVIYDLPGLSSPLNVNGTWLALVFEGSVRNWDDPMLQALNPGVRLPNEAITVVIRTDYTGLSLTFQQFLAEENPVWAQQYGFAITWQGPKSLPNETYSTGVGSLTGLVQSTPGAISYSSLDWALATGVGIAKVENDAGTFVYPTVSDASSAVDDAVSAAGFSIPTNGSWSGVSLVNAKGSGDYPIVSFVYLTFYQDPGKVYTAPGSEAAEEMLINFADWVLTSGQASVARDSFVPLPTGVVAADQTTLQQISWDGASMPTCS